MITTDTWRHLQSKNHDVTVVMHEYSKSQQKLSDNVKHINTIFKYQDCYYLTLLPPIVCHCHQGSKYKREKFVANAILALS